MIRCLNMIIRVGALLLFMTLDSDCKVPSGYSRRLACVVECRSDSPYVPQARVLALMAACRSRTKHNILLKKKTYNFKPEANIFANAFSIIFHGTVIYKMDGASSLVCGT